MARSVVSGLVRSDEITSTRRSTGTGLKKCIPMTCSGRFVAMATVMIGMDEVLVARMAVGSATASSMSAKDIQFESFVFGDRLDHQLSIGEVTDVGGEREVALYPRGVLFGQLAATPRRARVTCRFAGDRLRVWRRPTRSR